ncbi:MAG: hypothetical protein ABSG22_02625 [Sedimentisphaerales bacterium]
MKAQQNTYNLMRWISILALGINFAGAAEPFENLTDDTVLVEVLGQRVCLKDIEPNLDTQKKQRESTTNEQFALWQKQTRASNMGRYFRPLLDNYAKEKGLTITEQEIKEYKEKMINFMTSQKIEWKRKKDNLAKELVAENLKDDKKAELEKSFNLYDRLIEKSPDLNLIYYSTDSNIAKSVNDTTKSFILNYKIYQALYRQYKGRVIFQQAGPEPLDAFRQFFEEQQSKGKFKFYNKDAEDLFWDYYRNVKHIFITDPNEVEKTMNTKWWLQEKKENDYDAQAEWGEEVNGLQIRIDGDSGRRAFYLDKTPVFKIDLLNTGSKSLFCAALEQFCEVEIDGKWYKWNGPIAVDISTGRFNPRTVQYNFLRIKLPDNWASKEDNKNQLLNLSLGFHIIRVKYKTMYNRESQETEVISNSLKFQIIPSKSEKKND